MSELPEGDAEALELVVPMPLQIVVDDVGWWSGEDGSARGEPFRTGISRDHVPADYAAVTALGRALGMRPLAGFVAGEWDRHNRLRQVPSTNPQGGRWDNRHRDGPWLDEAAAVLRDGRRHLELAIHGLCHEYWDNDGRMSRTEFHAAGGAMRPPEVVVAHLELFARVLEDNTLGFLPKAFVPPAHYHSVSNHGVSNHGVSDGDDGMQAILSRFGVDFVTTHFDSINTRLDVSRATRSFFTVDDGVMLVDRREPFVPWNALDTEPAFGFDQPTLALHWPNLLHPDPERNLEVVARWVDFLRPYGRRFDGVLARDTRDAWTQIAHREAARVERLADGFRIDVAGVRALGARGLDRRFTVKARAPEDIAWRLAGGRLERATYDHEASCHVLELRSFEGSSAVQLSARSSRASA